MRLLFIIIFLLFSYLSKAQVKLLTLNELDARLANGKDTTYVINFWATWCTPCVAELPAFEALRLDNMNNPVKVLLISLDFKSKLEKAVIPFVRNQKLHAEVFILNEANQQESIQKINPKWSGGIPATLFINKKKRKFYERSFTAAELKKTFNRFQLNR